MCLLLVDNLFFNTIGGFWWANSRSVYVCRNYSEHYLNINMYKTSNLMFMISYLFYVVGLFGETTAGGPCKWLIHFLFVPNWFKKICIAYQLFKDSILLSTTRKVLKIILVLYPGFNKHATCVNVLIPNSLRSQV